MATLGNDDFTEIKQAIASSPAAKAVFKTMPISKATWKLLFQAAEDWFVTGFGTAPTTSFKAALDVITTTTVNQAKWIGKVWFAWRIGIDW